MPAAYDRIPYSELNRFYAEIVGAMHPALRPLATDLRVLRHDPVETHTANIAQELYQAQYSYVPWMVADYLALPETQLLTVGKAWWLTIIEVVITDQIVDRQVPDIPTLPLMLQHLRLHAEQLYRAAFAADAPFWSPFQAARLGIWNGLAHETYCVDDHQQVYTFAEMQAVCRSRSDLIGALLRGMGWLAGSGSAAAEPLCTFYENLTFADQLLDDASDWKSDFAGGRRTLPVVMALEKGGYASAAGADVPLAELELLVDRHRVLVEMAETATTLLETAQAALDSLAPDATPLRAVLDERLKVARYAAQRYHTLRAMTGFLERLRGA